MKKTERRITKEELQEKFLVIAHRYAEEVYFKPFREDAVENYDVAPESFAADFFSLCDIFSNWNREIKGGAILRILRYLGAYDGRKVHRDRLLTALRVVCFIGRRKRGTCAPLFGLLGLSTIISRKNL